jgi:hypothetical protein
MIGTITGDAGIGKTSTAATFPDAIFIRAEDGLAAIPHDKRPDALPVLTSPDDLWEQMTALIQEEHQYKTLVTDTVTQLDQLFCQHIIDSDPKKPRSINQALGGYGAGLQALGQMHARLRKACGMLRDMRGMHVIFIAHSDTVTIEPPDQDPYTRYDLRLNKRSISPYVDNVDLVGYIKLETFVQGDDDSRKKAISSGRRIMTTYTTATNISKNRYGITEDIPVELGVNPLVDYIPSLQQ